MDFFHRDSRNIDTRQGRECQFCRRADKSFAQRKQSDKLIHATRDDTAEAHFSEDGYVQHRLLEVKIRLRAEPVNEGAA
jgi:hypothetical protein